MLPMYPPPPPSPYRRVHPPPQPFYHAIPVPPPPPNATITAQPVWAWNFHDESDKLCRLAAGARYVAVNVQYPGLVHLPGKDKKKKAVTVEQRYALVKANVDALKPLQVGIALCDFHGLIHAWEFNLCGFHRVADPHDAKSLAYLAGRGLYVDKLAKNGIDASSIGAMLLRSGLIGLLRGVSWVTYTGTYHVAYLLKIVTGGLPLPQDVAGFLGAVRRFLGDQVYDVAGMASECPMLPVGLERIAAHLGFRPPCRSPRLAAAAGVRVLQVFRSLEYREFGGNVRRYGGLLQGLQY